MTVRRTVRIVSFACAIFIGLAIYSILSVNQANNYKAQLELSYQQSLSELSECLDGIETNLTKSVYSNSKTTLYDISSDLYSETQTAKDALSRLPVNSMNLNGAYKFLSQASDYSEYLAGKISKGETISAEEHKNLNNLLSYANTYKKSIDNMVSICNSGGKITDYNVKSGVDGKNVAAISNSFQSAEDAFEDYPTLLYDGPFADAVLTRDASMLKDAKKIDVSKAREIAAKAISCNISELSQESDENGKIEAFVFSYNQQTISITKAGGYISSILYSGKISTSTISQDNARNIAKEYLKKLGYENMEQSYFTKNNNICTINFAYTKDNVTMYSDLVKVGVSLNDGKILTLEAKGYLTNHIERDAFVSKAKIEDCEKNISEYLTIKSEKQCIIPKKNGKEVSCFEFHVESSETGEEALIYVNADTKEEEEIMLLLYSDNGTLTK